MVHFIFEKKPFKFSIGKGKKGRIIGFKLGGEEEERREELRDPLFFYVITAFWIDVIVFSFYFFLCLIIVRPMFAMKYAWGNREPAIFTWLSPSKLISIAGT